MIQRTRVRFPAGRPWSCIFRNWSRFGSYNVYLNDTQISYSLLWHSSIDNECKCQILLLKHKYGCYPLPPQATVKTFFFKKSFFFLRKSSSKFQRASITRWSIPHHALEPFCKFQTKNKYGCVVENSFTEKQICNYFWFLSLVTFQITPHWSEHHLLGASLRNRRLR